MTYTCPEGHSSASGDYCDVCGSPIAGSSPSAQPGGQAGGQPSAFPPPLPGSGGGGNPLDLSAPAPAGSSAAPKPTEQLCPHCAASNLPGAFFCENCGYDFTTGQLPRPLDPPAGVAPVDAGQLPADLAPPVAPGAPPTDLGAAADPGAVLATAPPVTPSSAPGHVEWVAEVWVDPDWYASQDVSEPCPSAGMPLVIPILERTVLIGRLSTSRNIHPQIDLSSDNGVSRRHAQLNSDGQRWWVEDLQSANGTFVGAAGAPMPDTPISVGQRVELADDDRIFIGAWTRVVVRKATPEESTLGS